MSDDDDHSSNSSPEKSPNSLTNKQPHISWSDSYSKAFSAIDSLKSVLPSIPRSLVSSENPASSLLSDVELASLVSQMLRRPNAGAVDDNLCAWLYDTFQSSQNDLHLVVLRFLPVLAGVYLSRATLNKPLAGFESVLLAIYAHETSLRNGQAVSVSIPDLSHCSIYHEAKQAPKNGATELHLAVITPSLEPHGTVRSTRRARIVGVALELYYTKIGLLPVGSKMEFCEFCKIWSGQGNVVGETDSNKTEMEQNTTTRRRGRIDLTWELLQPILRIIGHCLMSSGKDSELFGAAMDACKCLYERALHDMNPKAILAIGSLLKLAKISVESADECDYTEIEITNVIAI